MDDNWTPTEAASRTTIVALRDGVSFRAGIHCPEVKHIIECILKGGMRTPSIPKPCLICAAFKETLWRLILLRTRFGYQFSFPWGDPFHVELFFHEGSPTTTHFTFLIVGRIATTLSNLITESLPLMLKCACCNSQQKPCSLLR